MSLGRVLGVVKAVDAIKRISEELKAHSFFGRYDLWRYEGKYDLKICGKCLDFALNPYYIGTELRRKDRFPYLVIIDANTIEVRVHPHCRCRLHRVTRSWEYFLEIGPFLKEKDAKDISTFRTYNHGEHSHERIRASQHTTGSTENHF